MVKNLNEIDTVGRWFIEFEKRNECCDGIFGIYDSNNCRPQIRLYPHARYDGYSVMNEYLRELGEKDLPDHLKNTTSRKMPSLYKQVIIFFKFLTTLPLRPHSRKMKLKINGWPKNPLATKRERIAWRIFDKSDSERILAFSKKNNSTLNSYLIAKLINNINPIWANKKNKIIAGVTVSLHKNLGFGPIPSNKFSTIDIWLDESTSPYDINLKIKNNLKRRMHIASWIGYHLPKYIGSWFYGYFLLMIKYVQNRNIVFTNVGKWKANSRKSIFLIPPVFHHNPISIGVITWEEKLSIAIQFHPHLEIDLDSIEDIIENWSKELLCKDAIQYIESSRNINNLSIINIDSSPNLTY